MYYSELETKIKDYCDKIFIYGVIRVTHLDKIVFEQKMGYADIEKKTEFNENSMFSLYSLSKPFCTIGFMKLYEKGLVDIDAHPMEYIPEARGFDPRVTFKQALQHRSGLPDFEQTEGFRDKYAPGYPEKVREHLKLISKYPMIFAPDTKGKYENINILICAVAIENITGMSYSDYMKKEVFDPLGTKKAVVDNQELYIENRVKGYTLVDGRPCMTERSSDWMLGAGDIVATVNDVYRLNVAIKKKMLLSDKTWELILTPTSYNDMGMGCTVTNWHGKRRIHHNGGHTGFRTLHVQLPDDDLNIIILSNSGFGNARHDLSEMIYSAFYGDDGTATKAFEMDKGYAK
jgi:CubicO group peptidase (beta-lactamase class C family)